MMTTRNMYRPYAPTVDTGGGIVKIILQKF